MAVDFLINELKLNEKFMEGYYINYFDSVTGELTTIKYCILSAVDLALIEKDEISSFELFNASILSQIDNNTAENILSYHSPPVLFIEVWNFKNGMMKSLIFDNFVVKLGDIDIEYYCVGSLIHVHDHYKTIFIKIKQEVKLYKNNRTLFIFLSFEIFSQDII